MELITQIISGGAILLAIGVLIIFIKTFIVIEEETKTEQLSTLNDIESFLDIDMDTLLSETKTKHGNVQELQKKLNQFKNRNKFYNL